MNKVWNDELDARLRELWPRHKSAEIAEMMGMTQVAIQSRAKRLGLQKDRDFRGFWSPEEIEFFREHYPNTKNDELAEMLGRQESQVIGMAQRMRLKKSKEFWKHINSLPNAGKFGHRPAWNKGMKGLLLGSGTSRFKPSNIPHNEKYDGAITIRWEQVTGRPIVMYRLARKKWIPYSHHVFASYYGEIPKGMIIRHRNGNRLDFRLENLELVTKRQNYLKNSPSLNLSDGFVASTMLGKGKMPNREEVKKVLLETPELIETKRSIINLKRLCQPK
ncbi:HNH endonuclease signature motif containing protein [Runella limosa]|uniref:HNH endonuclease signature motif containing protein n=1 Tax=Runella limosa TaxID=370978 RepID=UPI00040B90E8|nr:HNH endonuclease signature motif containing protein [Runella limosa]